MFPRPTNLFLPFLFMAFIMCTAFFAKGQDSTALSIIDSGNANKPVPTHSPKTRFRRLLPHWNMSEKRADGPSALGVIIRTNPCTWVLYYSYEYVIRNVFWAPGS